MGNKGLGKKLRKLHIDGEVWKYVTHLGGATIFPPNQRTGELCFIEEEEDDHGYMAITPAAVKSHIVRHGHELRGIGKFAKKAPNEKK